MAITKEQQTEILKITVGLYNAAPGGAILTDFANLIEGGLTTRGLADALAAHSSFTSGIMAGKVTVDAQVGVLLKNFGLVADEANPDSAGSLAAAYFTDQLEAGVGIGEIVYNAIVYLSADPVPELFAGTATLLNNKVLVAEAYSATASSNDLSVLQTVLSKVTGTAPYTPADVQKALQDSGVSSNSGQLFSLIVGEDDVSGTSGDDIFKALVTENNAGNPVNTLESIDKLDGGQGNDTLTATLEGAGAAPSLNSIENVVVRFASVETLDLSNATGVTAVTVQTSTAGGNITNVGAVENFAVKNQTQNATFIGNTATSLNLTLDTVGNFTTPTINTITFDTGATSLNLTLNNANAAIGTLASVEALTVDATGTNEINQGSVAATTSATITGTGSVELKDAFTALTTLTATDNSGGVTAIVDGDAIAVDGGSGADNITYNEALAANAAVTLGGGDDIFTIAAASVAGATVDAGDDNDTLAVTDGSWLDADAADVYTNFETLEIGGGTGTYDMDNLPGLTAVTIGAALAGAADITNAAEGTTVTVNAEEATDLTLGQTLSYALKTATGTSDVVSLTLNALDGDAGAAATAEGVITVDSFTADDIETFDIVSNIDGIDADLANTDYTNIISALSGDSVETLNVSGSANLEITALTAAVLKTINASTLTGGLTVDASASSGVEFLGGEGDDDYTGTAGGDTITAGKGADTIELGAAVGATDTIILNAAEESVLNADVDGHDVITNFGTAVGGGSLDVIDVGAFGFTGQQSSALANKGALAASAVDGSTLSTANFFASGGVDRGVAIGTNGGNTFVFIDANKDGDFSATDDAVVQLTGVTDVTLANFGF